jgi:ABC-type branched-subunit amino acid transport system permease subunit
MAFVILKFLHIAFMFMGVALAVGPAVLLYLIARSSEPAAIGRPFALAERVFQVSTASYGLGIVSGFSAALVGALDLRASWLLTAYVLVAFLGLTGILYDNWTKGVARAFAPTGTIDADRADKLRHERRPLYLILAMVILVVAIVYVMVVKPSPF